MLWRLIFLAWLAAAPALSQDRAEVDVELLLMVDVSRSMTQNEREIQRRGYAEAFRSPDVIQAITGGLLGQAAVSYVEWAGRASQNVIVDWQVLASAEDAHAFADRLRVDLDPSLRRTSISGALYFAISHLDGNRFDGLRRVIDVSGDGPNNAGGPVDLARDMAVAEGITINGLPLMTREGLGGRWDLDDLDLYYQACVIGGPGAFVIPVRAWPEFAPAIRRKIVLELARTPLPRIWRAQATPTPSYDCQIGEKMWQRNREIWQLP